MESDAVTIRRGPETRPGDAPTFGHIWRLFGYTILDSHGATVGPVSRKESLHELANVVCRVSSCDCRGRVRCPEHAGSDVPLPGVQGAVCSSGTAAVWGSPVGSAPGMGCVGARPLPPDASAARTAE